MIKVLIMDVDGTLTDGKIYMGENGELFKSFDIKDGCGIKNILPDMDVIPVIITARKSKILENRCQELGINYLYQNVTNKYEKLNDILKLLSDRTHQKYELGNCAYIGDDIIDLQCMKPIKQANGVIGCPNDAVSEIKEISDFISSKNGGDGAVREFIEWIRRIKLEEIQKF